MSAIAFSLAFHLRSPLNGSFGVSRKAMLVRATERRRHRSAACLLALAHAKHVTLPVVVTLTRVAPRALDDDNLAAAFKSIRDGIADALSVDDRDPRVSWRYGQRRGKPREYAVEVQIAPAAQEARVP